MIQEDQVLGFKRILGSFGKVAVAIRRSGKSPEIVKQVATGLGGASPLQVETQKRL